MKIVFIKEFYLLNNSKLLNLKIIDLHPPMKKK